MNKPKTIGLGFGFTAAAGLFALAASARADEPFTQLYTGGTPSGTPLAVGLEVTIMPDGSVSVVNTGEGPYDGIDDTLVTVTNDASTPLLSLNLSGAGGADIFGFDGDGISTYTGLGTDPLDVGPNPYSTDYYPTSGYGSPDSYFGNFGGSTSNETGTVYFDNGGISAGGGTDYFSLEEAPNIAGAGLGVTTGSAPDAGSTLSLLGTVLLGVGFLRRKLGLVR